MGETQNKQGSKYYLIWFGSDEFYKEKESKGNVGCFLGRVVQLRIYLKVWNEVFMRKNRFKGDSNIWAWTIG